MSQPIDYASDSIPPEPPKGAPFIIFLIAVTDFMGFGIIIPSLAFYVPDFQHNPMKVTMLFSVYSICQFVAAPVLGMLSDRHGRRPILIISQIGSAVGYVILGVATQEPWSPLMVLTLVYTSRVIDGISGGNISTAQAYISDVTTPQTRAKGMGVLGAAFGLGFSIGPAIGGILGHIHLSLPGYVAAAFSAGAAVLTWARLPESRVHKPVDVEVWLQPTSFLPFLRRSVLMGFMTIGFMSMAAFVMMESTLAMYLNTTMGVEQLGVGMYYVFIGLIIMAVQGALIGRLTRRLGEWTLAIIGPALVALSFCGLTGVWFWRFIGLLGLVGTMSAIGRSLQQPTLSSLISKTSKPNEQGVVFGLYHGVNSLARIAGPVLAGWTYRWHPVACYMTAAGILAVASVWTAILAAWQRSRLAVQVSAEETI